MYNVSVWLSSLFMMFGTIWYCRLIIKDKVRPPISAFIILVSMFSLSYFMYVQNTSWSLSGNIGLTVATLSVWMVLTCIVTTSLYHKRLRTEFSSFQRKVMLSAMAALILWFVTENHLLSYFILQIIAVIGYIPIIVKTWGATEDNESLVLWTSIFLSALVASYAASERNDIEAWIYIGRAVPCTGIVVFQVASTRIKTINRQKAAKA